MPVCRGVILSWNVSRSLRSLQKKFFGSDVTSTWHEHRIYVMHAHLLPTAEFLLRYSRNGIANAIKVLQLAIYAHARRKLHVHVISMLRRFLKFYSVKTSRPQIPTRNVRTTKFLSAILDAAWWNALERSHMWA